MASGRIIKTQISLSEQVNDLSIHSALLFTWLIPHTDDFGRMYGNARRVKAIVVPMRDDYDTQKVRECLDELHSAKLIDLYKVDGDYYIQLPAFETHQTGLHKRTKSKYPDIEDADDIPGSSGNFPSEQEQETEQELEQEKEENTMSGKPDDADEPEAVPEADEKPEVRILEKLNLLTGHDYRPVESNLSLIRARLAEGHSQAEIIDVISMQVEQWTDTKMEQFLRPATLFNAQKFNQYVGKLPTWRREKAGELDWLKDDHDYIDGEVVNG